MKAVKISFVALAIAGICAGLTGSAHAQAPATTTTVTKPFTVKLGGLFPKDGDATLSVGLGYDFLKTKSDNPLLLQGYVDYFSSSSDDVNGPNGARIKNKFEYGVGVGVAARYMFIQATPKQTVAPYGFLGLGVYSVKGKNEVTTPIQFDQSTTVASRSKTKTGLGGKVGVGAELKSGVFGEVEYNFLPEVNDIKASGLGVRVGYRF